MVQRAIRNRLFKGFNSFDSITPQTELFDLELVKRDLLNHFETAKGERVMRPDFGSAIWDLLFEPFDADTREAIISDVDSIIDQESRVVLQRLDIVEFDHGLRLNIQVLYVPLDVFETFQVEFDRRNTATNAVGNISTVEDLV